ncbi:solute carrier family 38 member 10-like isoform X2 [Ornithodoros turicata]|uniref:solute carrier family 38 member 10-like isoform X2 n=1 Tax=Ornithodoros turicata TaxID=34597 RepID=UPI003139524C
MFQKQQRDTEMPSSSSLKNTVNLGNSIIGVSILAMPYCFQECGIILSSLLLLASGLLTRITSHLLLKSAIATRRRNYEFLAFHTFGPTGKLLVEIGILGFLLGSCIAFFVVVGDLGPPLVAQFLLVEPSPRLRTGVLVLLGTCVGLPLGLLRNLDSLTSFSIMSLVFYVFLILKIFSESFSVLWSGDWWSRVVLWKPENLLSVLPIFAMALSCQPQLFEIFDTVNEPSLKRMNSVVNRAVQLCSSVYFMMGFFGYVAFCGGGPIPGNVLVRVSPSLLSQVIKLGFVATLVVSFPLCLFPCRTSLHSLLFKRGSKHLEPSHIPVGQFRALTVLLVGVTVSCAVLFPDVEVVLALTGSSIGSLICIVMPALIFARLTSRETNERLLAQCLCCLGIFLMVTCTLTTLHSMSSTPQRPAFVSTMSPMKVVTPAAVAVVSAPAQEPAQVQKRVEPPEPQEPREPKPVLVSPKVIKASPVVKVQKEGLDPEALKKEDREIEESVRKKTGKPVVEKQESLLEKIAEEQKEQKKILEDLQKKLKEELLKHEKKAEEKPEKIIPPAVIPAHPPVQVPPQVPAHVPQQAPAQAPAQAQPQVPAHAPVQVLPQAPAQAPVQVPPQAPAQAPVQVLPQAPTQAPAQVLRQAPVQAPVQVLPQAPAQAPAQVLHQAPAQAPAQVLHQAPAQAPVQVLHQAPAQVPAQVLAQVPPSNKSSKIPAHFPIVKASSALPPPEMRKEQPHIDEPAPKPKEPVSRDNVILPEKRVEPIAARMVKDIEDNPPVAKRGAERNRTDGGINQSAQPLVLEKHEIR